MNYRSGGSKMVFSLIAFLLVVGVQRAVMEGAGGCCEKNSMSQIW